MPQTGWGLLNTTSGQALSYILNLTLICGCGGEESRRFGVLSLFFGLTCVVVWSAAQLAHQVTPPVHALLAGV